ncbi:MAG: LbtU family siderophore porin, partial [Gammaproteobacteria bacterium]
MVTKLKPITQALCLLSMSIACSSVFAAVSSSSSASSQQQTVSMQKIAIQEQQLQQQMHAMQKEMAELQQEEAALNAQAKPNTTTTSNVQNKPTYSTATSNTSPTPNKPVKTAYQENVGPVQEKVQNANGTTSKIPYGGTTLANIGGFAVITSPYLHPQVQYSGGDLIVNYSSINKDAYMLQQRQEFQQAMASRGFSMPSSGTLLELSGEVEGDAVARTTFQGNKHQTDLYVGDAELDMQALINRWLTAFMDFSYNNSPNSDGSRIGGDIIFDNGFFTFGNLNVTKFRLTMGQLYVPFGQFNSYLISDPINKTLFRTKGQPIILGYGIPGENGFSGALYTFKGVSFSSGNADEPNPYINQYGADANYQFNLGALQTTLGASYIANVADSYGMQFPGFDDPEFGSAPVGDGFSTSTETEKLAHTVPGLDLRGMLALGAFSLIGEYDTTTQSFNPADLSYNGEGASPSAYHVEGVFSFSAFTKPSTFVIGYDRSYQAMGLAVPQSRVSAAL